MDNENITVIDFIFLNFENDLLSYGGIRSNLDTLIFQLPVFNAIEHTTKSGIICKKAIKDMKIKWYT